MALKRKKLDAICAHLKKTSAVDVSATTQNGVTADVPEAGAGAAARVGGGVEVAVAEEGEVKAGIKPTSTNNNEETVTDLNENPEPLAVPPPPSETNSIGASREDEDVFASESVPSAKSTSCSSSIPTTSTAAGIVADASVSDPLPVNGSPCPTHLTSTPESKPSGAGRRKSRKAAKPRLVFQPTEQFHSDEEGEEESQDRPAVASSHKVGGEKSSILAQFLTQKNDVGLSQDLFRGPASPGDFTSQYSTHQQQPQQQQLLRNESIRQAKNFSSADSSSFGLAGVPLDLSTSRNSDNSEGLSTAEASFQTNNDNDDDESSTHHSSTTSSPAPPAARPPPPAHGGTHPGEAEGLADYATTTMNELLSIYGFGGSAVDNQLAHKQLDLSTLQALAASAQSLGKIPGALSVPSSVSVKVSIGQKVMPTNDSSAGEDLTSSGSSHGLATSGSGDCTKPSGNVTKYKFHNVKSPSKNASSNSNSSGASLQKISSSEYSKYIKKFHNGVECGGSHCRDLGYRDHYHCHDCNFKVFIKKEEMVRHYKWHKKRDESLQHGFLRFSPLDDCSVKYGSCTHNKRQTHYHCIQPGCDKVYISTSDVQMHANYHRKDSAIIQEGFQRFRATEDCGTTTCSFYGQRTTHFHCRRSNCNFTFKHKADMEKHKSYHQKDEILGRDGFKKFMKYEHCSYNGCRYSKISNHIHCIRPGCSYVLHSTAQLYSHKRKHERREFENLYRTFRQAQRPPIQPATEQTQANNTALPPVPSMPGLPSSAIALGSKVSLTSLPVQGYGEPMVAGPLLQPVPLPMKLEGRSGSIVAPSVTVVSAETQKQQTIIGETNVSQAQPLALTTAPVASHTSTSGDTRRTETVYVKQEPKSDIESEGESKSASKSVAALTLPFSKMENLKSENLNDSLNLSIPGQSSSQPTGQEATNLMTAVVSAAKSVSDASIGVDTSNMMGQMLPLRLPKKRVGAPEKRERDESWKNYLIRYTANDPCHSRCVLLYKDHYHCKIAGCQVLFRSKDGVREHARFHDLQDRITPMVYDKYESTEPCPQGCELSKSQTHYHCNWTGCNHCIPEVGQTFARLEHYRIHEYAKASAGKNYRTASGSAAGPPRVEDMSHRRRGRPPKYPRLGVPSVPKVELSEQEIQESNLKTADGEGVGLDEKIINGFKKFDSSELCPDDQCMYRSQLHYHCGRPRCHTATDRIDVLNLHAKDFHSFVNILEHFEFFDRNVNCRRVHCSNNRTNRHYHCTRPSCDYSFVRHSTMAQHNKKHSGPDTLVSAPTLSPGARITPIQLLRRPDGQTYIPIVPAPASMDKSVVKAAGTFYPLSGLPNAVSATPVGVASASTGQPMTSNLTLTIPANLVNAGIPVMAPMASTTLASASSGNVVPVIAGNMLAGPAMGAVVSSAQPLTVLLQQKSSNGAPQPSWSSMRSSMHYSLQASCGRPFCKLKKKDHYHCLECNQAFSDPARLRGHISKHGVKFKKLSQAHTNVTSAMVLPLPLATVKSPEQQQPPVEMGLDLSTSRSKEDTASKVENSKVEAEDGSTAEDDNDSLSSSLNLSVGHISACLTPGSSSGMGVSDANDAGNLVIDEVVSHTEEESMMAEDGIVSDDGPSTSGLSPSTPQPSSPSTSRRSARKRTAPDLSDFVSSDDASLMAKQMKLKLSAPIPSSAPSLPMVRNVPQGFIRFHCSSDCGYMRCAYRQSVTHFHCVRPECGYGFSDKSRIIQHRLRHERLDKLMGGEFQQFRATVCCGHGDCEFSEKASHFHCQKCAFVCADSSKVLAHRKYHAKMDNISNNGFAKFGALQPCGVMLCNYNRKQTHYHCMHDGCNHAVLGPAQMAPHKLKHAAHDV